MSVHVDIPFSPTFKERLDVFYKLLFHKEITIRFEWDEPKWHSNPLEEEKYAEKK